MEEAGFPGQHATTTTVTSSTTVQTNIRFDSSYLRTFPGILKVVQIVASLIGFICVQFAGGWARSLTFFCVVTGVAFWFSGLLLSMYLFHIIEKLYKIPWLKVEFLFCAAWGLLYLIAASIVVSFDNRACIAAGVFGFVATVAYALDCFLKWRGARGGGLAQGSRVVSKQTTSAAPAAPSARPEGY